MGEFVFMLKYSIIPKPVKYEAKEEKIEISKNTAVLCSEGFLAVGHFLSSYLKTVPNADGNKITITKVNGIAKEGYALYSENGDVSIKASTETGAFYGAVTLKWILMQAQKKNGTALVNGFFIEDKPNYSHRGMMLDESRHFFGTEIVKSVLDNMSMLKMNVFHWHLCDDQGYRIESRAFPLLNEIGSCRSSARLQGFNQKNDNVEYGPYFYTFEQIKDIVSYAKELHITVIPEIDVPGHSTALLASYPEYACKDEKVEVAITNGILEQILCAGDENTYDFLDKLFDEICPLFESDYFHIGGDEAKYGHWKECERCQQMIKENNIEDEKHLQMYFMGRVNELLKKHGKKCIAWNDCLNDNLDKSITCQYWIFTNKAEVKKQAYSRDIILSPMFSFYLDLKHSKLPLERVYSFNEKANGFDKENMRIKGVEAPLWTEWIDTKEAVEYSIYPRLAAVAEVGWTPLARRNVRDFKRRVKFYKLFLESRKINYYRIKHFPFGSYLRGMYSFGRYGREFRYNEKRKKKESKEK